jgi:hypothetical protein
MVVTRLPQRSVVLGSLVLECIIIPILGGLREVPEVVQPERVKKRGAMSKNRKPFFINGLNANFAGQKLMIVSFLMMIAVLFVGYKRTYFNYAPFTAEIPWLVKVLRTTVLVYSLAIVYIPLR